MTLTSKALNIVVSRRPGFGDAACQPASLYYAEAYERLIDRAIRQEYLKTGRVRRQIAEVGAGRVAPNRCNKFWNAR